MNDIHLANDKIDIYAHAKWEDAMTDFHITEEGLSEDQVIHNREKYGDNQILENKADTFFYRFRRAFVNPFSIILFVLALISFGAELLMNGGYRHDFSTAIIIICMLVISGTVRLVQEMQAKKVSDNLLSMVVSENLVRRDGQWKVLSSSEIVVGDIAKENSIKFYVNATGMDSTHLPSKVKITERLMYLHPGMVFDYSPEHDYSQYDVIGTGGLQLYDQNGNYKVFNTFEGKPY